jgi:ABC-type sugar transport system substrate-binding protein
LPARIALALVDGSNQFQRLLQQDAERVARTHGVQLETVYTGESFTEHLAALRRLANAVPRPDAIAVMAVRDQGLARVVREAAAAGIHFAFLNAVEDDLDAIRRDHPAVAITSVCPDEVDTGRVQGRQLCALVPPGRRALYVQGSARSLASRQRTAGMQETTAGKGFDVVLAGGDWSPEHAARTVREWLRFAVSGRKPFDLVACQNDHMAAAVVEELARAAAGSSRPDLARIPVTGCDGAPDVGQRLVLERRLAATVILPRVAGPAVEILARLLATGERPADVVAHDAAAFPPLAELQPMA